MGWRRGALNIPRGSSGLHRGHWRVLYLEEESRRRANCAHLRAALSAFSQSAKYALLLTVFGLGLGCCSYAQVLPNTGQRITPTAPANSGFVPLNPGLSDNPTYTAGQAATSVISPDGKTLLVLVSGYNLVKTSTDRRVPIGGFRGWRRASLCGLDVSKLSNTHSLAMRQPQRRFQTLPNRQLQSAAVRCMILVGR
jgi:hypothetical protein